MFSEPSVTLSSNVLIARKFDLAYTPQPTTRFSDKVRLFLVFAFSQVQWKRFLTYFKTIGIKYCILVVALYLASEGLSLMGNIWLSVWTEDPSLKFSNNTTQGHEELRHRQIHYLGGYLGFGIGQGTSFLLEIGSFLKQSGPYQLTFFLQRKIV